MRKLLLGLAIVLAVATVSVSTAFAPAHAGTSNGENSKGK